ncbi:hypothetical protein MHU86_608 [Fragilaria crotonensis]|nr:hypothetical protein MHU86_608 [Fragilaria crotonensis]
MGLIGSLLSLPYMLLFFGIWLAASLIRPLFLACIVHALTKPLATARKLQLFKITVEYLLLCNDKKFPAPKEDPRSFFKDFDPKNGDTKTIIFVRHGESTWNDTFNRGDRSKLIFILYFIPNLIKSLYYEAYFFVTGQAHESWFFDSPLSDKGLNQARGIATFLQEANLEYSTPREADLIKVMLGDEPSTLVSSNLRRAISTAAIGFQPRFVTKPEERMLILPQLQEMSRNPDALCITPAQGKIRRAWTDPEDLEELFATQIDAHHHTGNKPVDSSGLARMQDFCKIIFDDIEGGAVIAVGHSFWFRSFFRTFLPHDVEHVSKKKKLVNGGCVGFTMFRTTDDETGNQYMIDPKSITILYGGF